ncbi:hypothetical protein CHS0354_001980 [Potamilus streckersoni]|uniref:DUF411 domain-containing protein n=1 Tax=Potamilus streckersoni TaxID=2493646 RepID=A0AAE0T636_9BIVA|nr:hypothetical protein CHS0354_001980 [Potamilus streckersoni]
MSNPPYVSADEMNELPRESQQYEPRAAFYGGQYGLDFYRLFAERLYTMITPGGYLIMEYGWQQKNAVMQIFAVDPHWELIGTYQDINGKDRVITFRTTLLLLIAGAVIMPVLHAANHKSADKDKSEDKGNNEMIVYKDPNCGCCKKWVEHMRQNGFVVKEQNVSNVQQYKESLGVPREMASCHTAAVNGYFVEGHVPAEDVIRLIKSKSAEIKGLAVPGMPTGSPGMEQGFRKDPYDVIAVKKNGQSYPYQSHR